MEISQQDTTRMRSTSWVGWRGKGGHHSPCAAVSQNFLNARQPSQKAWHLPSKRATSQTFVMNDGKKSGIDLIHLPNNQNLRLVRVGLVVAIQVTWKAPRSCCRPSLSAPR